MESPKFVSADKCSCADSLDATLALLILLWFCAEDIQMPDSQGTKSRDSPEAPLWEVPASGSIISPNAVWGDQPTLKDTIC
jgi:hypothetical protein